MLVDERMVELKRLAEELAEPFERETNGRLELLARMNKLERALGLAEEISSELFVALEEMAERLRPWLGGGR